MDNEIEIPIDLNGAQRSFFARIIPYGYTYRLSVDVNGTEVFFEPDEQDQYRVIITAPETNISKADKEIIKSIAEVLGELK